MLLLRGATPEKLEAMLEIVVSIHAPLARSNAKEARSGAATAFQYMLLLRGATGAHNSDTSDLYKFQYMLLLRGATGTPDFFNRRVRGFNTCSSCEEQRPETLTRMRARGFNTCSSCEEQQYSPICSTDGGGFNTCSSCEEQRATRFLRSPRSSFNTCSSCEEQLFCVRGPDRSSQVSIHAPLARSNSCFLENKDLIKVSIHAPLARSNCFAPANEAAQTVSIHAPLARSNKK